MQYDMTKIMTMMVTMILTLMMTMMVFTWWSSFAKHPISRPSCFLFLIRIMTIDHYDHYDRYDQYGHYVAHYDGAMRVLVLEK